MDQHSQDPFSPPPIPQGSVVGQSPNIPPNIPFDADTDSPAFSRPRRTPIWLWIITLGLLAVLVKTQRPEEVPAKEIRDAAAGIGTIHAPEASEFILVGKIIFFFHDFLQQAAAGGASGGSAPPDELTPMLVGTSDQFAGWVGTDETHPASVTNPPKRKKGEDPTPAADRLRAAILAGEFLDKDEMEWRIRDVEQSLDAGSELRDDARIIRAIYGLPSASTDGKDAKPADPDAPEEDADAKPAPAVASPAAARFPPLHTPTDEELAASHEAAEKLSDAEKKSFRERHGWFARLALSRGNKSSTLRGSASTDGMLLIVFLSVVGFIVLVAGIVGLVLLVMAFIRLSKGQIKWRFARPHIPSEWPPHEDHHPIHNPFPKRIPFATPGSVWLETVAVFFAMFLGVKLAVSGIGSALKWGTDAKVAALLLAQWLVALSIFWPILRGMPFSRWREEIGWKSQRGVFREILAGIGGYLAGLPVYFGMAIIVVIITLIISALSGHEPRAVGNKLTSVIEGGSPWELLLVFTLATIWAPIVEESIFRGCLFRHFRRRTGLIIAALLSATVFAILHGYLAQQLLMVATLGFWFAIIREWRGNIIATATAHALHNGFVMSILLITLSFARG